MAWEKVLPSCSPHLSPVVWAEASEGDPVQARARVACVRIVVSIVNDRIGLRSPVICTPEELMEV